MSENGDKDIIRCPVDGCDYKGKEEQVSSHANAKTDHPNWAEIKTEALNSRGESEPTAEESGKSKDSEASKADDGTAEAGPEGGASGPSEEETGESTDSETPNQGEKDPEGAGTEDEDFDTDMNEEQEQWSKVDGESGDGSTEREVDEAGDGKSGDSTGDDGLGIPIPVSSTTLFIGVGLVVMGVLLYKWATMSDETGESSGIEPEELQQDDEEVPTEGGLMAE